MDRRRGSRKAPSVQISGLGLNVNGSPDEWSKIGNAVFHSPNAYIIIILNMVRSLSTEIYYTMDSEFMASHGEKELYREWENGEDSQRWKRARLLEITVLIKTSCRHFSALIILNDHHTLYCCVMEGKKTSSSLLLVHLHATECKYMYKSQLIHSCPCRSHRSYRWGENCISATWNFTGYPWISMIFHVYIKHAQYIFFPWLAL